MFSPATLVTCCCYIVACALPVQAAPSMVETLGMWSGQVKDAALRELAPASDCITEPGAWQELYKKWQPEMKVPRVDFTQHLVLVGTVAGPNRVILNPSIDKTGNVTFIVAGTKRGGPGFGYKLILVKRQGIKTVNGKPLAQKGVQGTVLIPGKVARFEQHTLEIKLWEYDPFLADVGATLIDQFQVKKYQHTQGKETNTPFRVGTQLDPRKDRRYYITVFVLNNGKRTHIGEKDGKPGLCNVLTGGHPNQVKIVTRPVR